jgi:hypothetical protein
MASFRISRRFATSPDVICDIPVMLPPWRFRLSTSFVPTGSPSATITIGIVLVAFLSAWAPGVVVTAMMSGFRWRHSAASSGYRSLRPSWVQVVDRNGLSVNVAKVAQTFDECFEALCGRLRRARIKRQKAEPRDPLRRLCPCQTGAR